MSDFVDIRPGTDAPLLLNTKNLSVIMRLPEQTGTDATQPAKMTLDIYDATLGRQLWLDEASWKIDGTTTLSALKNANTNLFPIPLTWLENKNYGTAFVNPETFLSIITSAPYIPDGETEEHVGLLLDMAGYGRIESHAVPVKVIEDFMAQVKIAKPHLMIIDPKVATARFSSPGFVAFDLSKVTMIRPNGYDLDVCLQDGVKSSARIDFNLKDKKGKNLYSQQSQYATELLKRATARGFVWPTDPQERETKLNDFFSRTQRHYEITQARLKDRFAAAVAHKNPDLVKIENAKDTYYTTTHGVAAINCHEKTLSIHFSNTDFHRNEPLNVRFESEDNAKIETRRLQKLLMGT